MKANPTRTWSITLRGAKRTQAIASTFTGTIDAALAEADVLECQVRWQILRVEISASVPSVSSVVKLSAA